MSAVPARPVLIAFILAGCNGWETTVVSSRTSPNGSMVAENVFVDDANGGVGHLIIRSAQAKDGHDHVLDAPAGGLFMRWVDDSHLELWREGALGESPGPDRIGDVQIVRRSYVFPNNSPDTYRRPGISAETIAVPVGNVAMLFDQPSSKNERTCRLSIETTPDPLYDTAKVEITVGVNTDRKRDRPSAGVSTRFTLVQRVNNGPQTMLTSATISDIPSSNRYPQGTEGALVRGQFVGQNAEALIEQLKQPSIQIQYSRDFFEQVLRYDVPLAGSAQALGEFKACVGNADLRWLEH
jgi:hypothetical protein